MYKLIKLKANNLIKKHSTNNPFEIAAGENIIVTLELLGSISGFYNKYARQKFIHINTDMDEHNKLFTCCHEIRHYGERYKMVSDDNKPAKPVSCSSNHSPFYHYHPSEIRKSIRFLSSDQSDSSLVGRMSTYAASSAFLRVSVSALAYTL